MKNTELAAAFRRAADVLDGLEGMPDLVRFGPVVVNLTGAEDTQESAADWAHALAPCAKRYGEELFHLEKYCGGLVLDVIFWREKVCRRVEIGRKTVPEAAIPASPELFIPSHEEPIYEWQCPPILGEEEKANA